MLVWIMDQKINKVKWLHEFHSRTDGEGMKLFKECKTNTLI